MPLSPLSSLAAEQEHRIRCIADPVRRANATTLFLALRRLDNLIVAAWAVPLAISGGAIILVMLVEPRLDPVGLTVVVLAGIALAAGLRILGQTLYFSRAQRKRVAEVKAELQRNSELRACLALVFELAPGIGSRCKILFE